MGVWEIMSDVATPDEVVIDEIVTLASDLSTDESPAFLNGLLAKIVSVKHRISID
jgi:N utilization substance protein B